MSYAIISKNNFWKVFRKWLQVKLREKGRQRIDSHIKMMVSLSLNNNANLCVSLKSTMFFMNKRNPLFACKFLFVFFKTSKNFYSNKNILGEQPLFYSHCFNNPSSVSIDNFHGHHFEIKKLKVYSLVFIISLDDSFHIFSSFTWFSQVVVPLRPFKMISSVCITIHFSKK